MSDGSYRAQPERRSAARIQPHCSRPRPASSCSLPTLWSRPSVAHSQPPAVTLDKSMSSPTPHGSADESAEVADAKDTERENRPSSVRITVTVQNRYTFDIEVVTGQQIKETANVPPGFALYRRVQGGSEPIPD